jgi:hypothetical protein
MKYNTINIMSTKNKKKKAEPEEKSNRRKYTDLAGLTLNVAKTQSRMRQYLENVTENNKPMLRECSYVFMASVLEQICKRIFKSAIKECNENKKGVKVLNRKYILRGIKYDAYLHDIFFLAIAKNDPTQDYSDASIVSNGDLVKLLETFDDNIKLDSAGRILIRYLLDHIFCHAVRSAEKIRLRSKVSTINLGNMRDSIEILFDGKPVERMLETAEKSAENVSETIKEERQKRETKNGKGKKKGGKKPKKAEAIEEDEDDEEVVEKKKPKRNATRTAHA